MVAMNTLPNDIIAILAPFALVFSRRVFEHVKVLVCGAVLATGKRTVTSALRAVGLSWCEQFQNYHRILNRDKWSGRMASCILLKILVDTFAASGPVLIGIDETLERRRGSRIKAKGIYRDSVRSSKSFFVKSSGLRWVSMMLLVPVPWADRVWALPFMTVLAPSERYNKEHGREHKRLTDWARQMIMQVRKWLPNREIVVVGDSTYAALELLESCSKLKEPVTLVSRLRMDAALYAFASKTKSAKGGRPRKKGNRLPSLQAMLTDTNVEWTSVTVPRWYSQGKRDVEIISSICLWYHSGIAVPIRWVLIRDPQGKFEPQALLSTDLDMLPVQIISNFVCRWQIEVTFQEVRTHLGVETQRQWNDLAIARTTPALMAVFSLITLMAHEHFMQEAVPIRAASWYVKEHPTFSDAIAYVRRRLWQQMGFEMSIADTDDTKSIQAAIQQIADSLCYAA